MQDWLYYVVWGLVLWGAARALRVSMYWMKIILRPLRRLIRQLIGAIFPKI